MSGLAALGTRPYTFTSQKSPMPQFPSGLIRFSRTLPAATLLGLGCAFPSDQSDEVFVILDAPAQVIERGQTASAHRAGVSPERRRFGGASGGFVALDVEPGHRRDRDAHLTQHRGGHRCRAGRHRHRARGPGLRPRTAPRLRLRVAAPVTIDSILPLTAAYGGQITLFGRGLGEVEQAVLGDGALYPISARSSRNRAGWGG